MAEITKITWEDCNFKDLSGKQVGYLDTIYLVIQTKDIPYGETLNITVWEYEYVFSNRKVGTLTAKVGKNGKAEVVFNSTLLKAYQKKLNDMAWFWNDFEHQYYVQIEYSDKMNTIQDKTQLKVKNTLKQLVKPDNVIKPLVVTSNIDIDYGLLKPVRAKFETDYDVCHDIVKDFDDYDNFFVLENDGKYDYHWLGNGLTRTATDQTKPNQIPITVSSNQKLSVTITIESNTETSIQLRLVDPNRNYVFNTTHNHKGKGKSEYKFESDNEPFKDYVRYFSTYYLSLELSSSSTDNAWVPAGGHISVRLYITREEIDDSLLSVSSEQVLNPSTGKIEGVVATAPDKVKVLKNAKNGSKLSILETLLFIGCKYADTKKENDDIVNGVFNHLSTLSVSRVRHIGESMTYWRKGEASGLPGGMSFRGVRYLLKNGEARCGEWTLFFHDICIIQGVRGLYSFAVERKFKRDRLNNPTHYIVDSEGFFNCLMLVKDWTIDPDSLIAPVDKGASAQNLSNAPLNMFWDHVFSKYNNKYYDASYGIKSTIQYADDDRLLEAYCLNALTGILYVKKDVAGQPIHDHLHSGQYADPMQAYTLIGTSIPADTYNYEYKIVNTSMQNELDREVYLDA